MKRLRASLLAALALVLLAAPLRAQTKIGIIDLKRVFEGYYRTKQADAQLKERAADFKKTGEGMLSDYQKANEEYKKLLEGANDQAIAVEERDRRKKSAETKLRDLQEIEQNVSQFDRQSKSLLGEQMRRSRDNVLREIREVVNAKAKSAGFTLVLDTAAETVYYTAVILYHNGENDLTETVLKELNASAPPALLNAPTDKDEKKDEKKEPKK